MEACPSTVSNEHSPAYLSLEDVTPDRSVAQRLPAALAWRYHALPVAHDDGCTTVVMADPSDQAAREAVSVALAAAGNDTEEAAARIYLVRGDPDAIDRWLAELFPQTRSNVTTSGAGQGLELWLRDPIHGDRQRAVSYAESMASLLSASLRRLNPLTPGPSAADLAASVHPALVILPCLDFNLLPALLDDSNGASAVLLACQPRWPLRRLLVIVRGDQVDDAALAWAARLMHSSGAAATALMIAPHAPTASAQPAQDGISTLLSTHHAIGRKMQHAAQSLAAMQLDAVLHLRQGAPETVIREELASAPYDLAIAGVAVRSAEAQWRLRPLLHKLLPDLGCPLLLTSGR